MHSFDINKIQTQVKGIYISQKKWSEENWIETLKKHNKDIESLLEKVNLLDIWSNSLQNNEVARKLIPEIFMDAFISVHFICMGLYKYANACLRSELETALRIVYFSTHPVEYKWWCDNSEWYLRDAKDVWGKGYNYFNLLKRVIEFNKNFSDQKLLFNNIRNIYKKLSQYVHSSKSAFQTSLKFLPKYNVSEFTSWYDNYLETQQYVNIIFVLGFDDNFKKMSIEYKKKILKKGILDKDYKKKLKELFQLKIKGRI